MLQRPKKGMVKNKAFKVDNPLPNDLPTFSHQSVWSGGVGSAIGGVVSDRGARSAIVRGVRGGAIPLPIWQLGGMQGSGGRGLIGTLLTTLEKKTT